MNWQQTNVSLPILNECATASNSCLCFKPCSCKAIPTIGWTNCALPAYRAAQSILSVKSSTTHRSRPEASYGSVNIPPLERYSCQVRLYDCLRPPRACTKHHHCWEKITTK